MSEHHGEVKALGRVRMLADVIFALAMIQIVLAVDYPDPSVTKSDAAIAESQSALEAYAERHGHTALQSAISGGQYRHPDGIFFGGHRPTWSRAVMEEVFAKRLARARRVAVVEHEGTDVSIDDAGEEAAISARADGQSEQSFSLGPT